LTDISAKNGIPQVDDLSGLAESAKQQKIPTIVFISRDACPYCRTLRQAVLEPMYAADKFANRGILVEVNLDRIAPLTWLDGRQTTARDIGHDYKAQLTPTLLFLDSDGREISPRRVGISNIEFYSHYLNKSIDAALAVLAK
jgi:thioredoxin-related protein